MTNSSESWSCQLYIRWEFNDSGFPLAEIREVPFGPRFTENKDVELMLRRAQAAVLNSQKDISYFLTLTVEALRHLGQNQLFFSRNTVCVDLSAPELTDLTFIDLPGTHCPQCWHYQALIYIQASSRMPNQT